jgi:hypothetical protein
MLLGEVLKAAAMGFEDGFEGGLEGAQDLLLGLEEGEV